MEVEKIKRPKVSIWSITYNHAPYIEDCLKGILMQQTNFDFELIIGDDASTDGTSDILRDYANRYPAIIKPIIQEKNVGVYSNSIETVFPNLIGKYIAICEGDDYWTDPLKLQKQVDFLEKNKEYEVCVHNSMELSESLQEPSLKTQPDGDFESIVLNGLSSNTLSVVFRNKISTFPKWFYESSSCDLPLYLLLLVDGGKIKYMDDVMGVYRIHSGGVWSTVDKKRKGQAGVDVLAAANKGFGYEYDSLFKDGIANRRWWFGLKKYSFTSYLNGEVSFTFIRKYLMNSLNKKIRTLISKK